MAEPVKQLDNSAYAVGWIAALPHERAAAEAMLDEKHGPPQHKQPNDDNIYTLGSIQGRSGDHNIVIASLPAGRYGITPAATAAAHMLSSFPAVKFGVMAGIGGGIPNLKGEREIDIRLGDVVVSLPEGSYGGVRQYDLGKATVGGFKEMGTLNCPPRVLLNGVSALQGKHEIMGSEIPRLLVSMWEKYPAMARPRQGPGYVYQGAENDRLFQADYEHVIGSKDCRTCDAEKQIKRAERLDHDPYIFYGTIASGNKVIKDPRERDLLIGCLCAETEAAGLMNDFPCLIIRGICDYCDSHNNEKWQRYAAATAAAYTKELLSIIDVADVMSTPEARTIVSERRWMNNLLLMEGANSQDVSNLRSSIFHE
ncbi:nucleoside phosphorylase domain-containing protein [Aspergillus granulosus]|uniref:Nucleoside phosphorylase domain-containing protein n=1 Tax=Aspergillus granulosus TaxID=176169 RepID=A0ABR4H3K5_9EURO